MTKYNKEQTLTILLQIHNEAEIQLLIGNLQREQKSLDAQVIEDAEFYSKFLKNFPLSALPLLPEALGLTVEQKVDFIARCIDAQILTLQKEALACNALNLITCGLPLQDCRSLYEMAHQVVGAAYVDKKEVDYQRHLGGLERELRWKSREIPPSKKEAVVKRKNLESLQAKLERFGRDHDLTDFSNPDFQIPANLKAPAEFADCENSFARKRLQYTYDAVGLEDFLLELYQEEKKLPKADILENTEAYFAPSLHMSAEVLPLLVVALDLNRQEKEKFLINCARVGLLSFAEGHYVMHKLTQDFSDEEWLMVKQEADLVEFRRIKTQQVYLAFEIICHNVGFAPKLTEAEIAKNLCEAVKNGKLNLLQEEDWLDRLKVLKDHFPANYLLEFCEALFPLYPEKELEATKQQEVFVRKCVEIGVLNFDKHRAVIEKAELKFFRNYQEGEEAIFNLARRINEEFKARTAQERGVAREAAGAERRVSFGGGEAAAAAADGSLRPRNRRRARSDAVSVRSSAQPLGANRVQNDGRDRFV
jgi:hypothetical protein